MASSVQKSTVMISFGQVKSVEPVCSSRIITQNILPYPQKVITWTRLLHMRGDVLSGVQLVWIIEVPDKQGPDNQGCTVYTFFFS